jgi:hypothetical protein
MAIDSIGSFGSLTPTLTTGQTQSPLVSFAYNAFALLTIRLKSPTLSYAKTYA